MKWRLIVYRLPSEPSRFRVAAWRHMVKVGALSLHQSMWAIPSGSEFDESLDKLRGLVDQAEGQLMVFDVDPSSESIPELESLYTEQREAEWIEFIAECGKFDAEIDREFAKEKFTLAELDEEEQNLDRLKRWYRELRVRDQFGAESAPLSEERLKSADQTLERFAEAVFQARQQS